MKEKKKTTEGQSSKADGGVKRCFAPLVSENSKILILGSLPGKKSLEAGEYYANPHNHFWPIMFWIFSEEPTSDYSRKCDMLLKNGVAVWDVAESASREGSMDSKITNMRLNDIPALLKKFPRISFLIFNGAFALSSWKRSFGAPLLPHALLLSTSPACAGRFDEKRRSWREAIERGLSLSAND